MIKTKDSILLVLKQGGSWPFLGHLIALIGQFALLKIIALIGTVELFGTFALTMAVVAGLNILLFGPLTQWAIRHYQESFENSVLKEYYALIHGYILITILVIFLLLLVTYIFGLSISFLEEIGFGTEVVIFSVLFALLTCINDLLSSILNATSNKLIASFFFVINSWGKVLAVGIVFISGDVTLINILHWIVILLFMVTLLQYWFLKSVEVDKLKKNICKIELTKKFTEMKTYILPFLIWGIAAYVGSMGDRWIVAKYLDASSLGIYAAMVISTLSVVSAINAAYSKAVIPFIFRVSGSGEDRDRFKYANKTIHNFSLVLSIGYIPLLIIYYLWPDVVISIFTSADYTNYSGMLWHLMIGAIAFNLSQFLITHGLVNKEPKIYLPAKIFHGVFLMILLVALVPIYGVSGAVYAVLLSHITQLSLVIMINKKFNRFRISLER